MRRVAIGSRRVERKMVNPATLHALSRSDLDSVTETLIPDPCSISQTGASPGFMVLRASSLRTTCLWKCLSHEDESFLKESLFQ